MSKCRNEIFLGKIKQEKLSKETEVTFAINESLPDCRLISANKYINEPTNASWAKYDIPQNQFECEEPPCGNTGTLSYEGSVVYFVEGNEWASGIVTFYTKETSGNITVTLSANQSGTPGVSYTVNLDDITASADGFKPIVVDLSQTGTNVGDGWTPAEVGNYITITGANGVSVSSIAVYDSIDDFNINHVVKISCLSGIDGDTSIDAAEAECWDEGYDTSTSPTLERTITGRLLTPNYWLLNPMLGKGRETEGFEDVTIEVTAIADGVVLPNLYDNGCAYVGAMVADPCDITDSMLKRISIPTRVNLEQDQFQIVGDKIYFASALNGKKIIVSYPRKIEVEEIVADERNIGTRKVKMSFPYCTSDGTKYIKVFNNVLITSFPEGITNEEQEFEFTVAIRRDAFGHYYKIYRVL